jgi:hypothetical protein
VDKTHQVEDDEGSGLVLGVLCAEEQALAGLTGPGGGRVGDGRLLVGKVVPELLDLDGVIAEPEVALGEDEAPRRHDDGEYSCLV